MISKADLDMSIPVETYLLQQPAHGVVAESAQLGAGQLGYAGLRRHEPDLDGHTRHHVLADAKIGYVEAVNHVLGAEPQSSRPVHRQGGGGGAEHVGPAG